MPINPDSIGLLAREVMPIIKQVFIGVSSKNQINNLEQLLYILRKNCEKQIVATFDKDSVNNTYICSLSSTKIVYKGLLTSEQVPNFYSDLKNSAVKSTFGLVHSRFSTNTLGDWKLAHPYRFVAHNGEINTVRGNRNWMLARESELKSKSLGSNLNSLSPICDPSDSDTASFDNVLELLSLGGRELEHSMAMMIPESWDGHEDMDQKVKDFYKFHSILMEPWDGPALIVCTDGKKVGAVLDRNGLRPFRYTVTKDGLLIMGSETGLIEVEEQNIKYRERLRPGRMFLLDFEQGRIIDDSEIKNSLAVQKPYSKWLQENSLSSDNIKDFKSEELSIPLVTLQQIFGYSQEDINILIEPMISSKKDPVGSMGSDTPLSVLSKKPQNMFSYFRQMFAQVSNPPLDAIREKLVTQISIPAGKRHNVLEESERHSKILFIENPIMTNEKLSGIKNLTHNKIKPHVVSTLTTISLSLIHI